MGYSGVWLEAAHIIGRTYRALRWELSNGMALCSGCHKAYDQHLPIEKKIRAVVIGNEKYEWLAEHKKIIAKNQDYEAIRKKLTEDYDLYMQNLSKGG